MRTKLIALPVVMATVAFAGPLHAGSWSGTIKLGGIVLDEEGDYSAVQETFNIYDGFSVSQLRLSGSPDDRHFVSLDLKEINLDARRGTFLFRHPGTAKITASFDQSRQVFDPDRATTSDRQDWRVGARFTPARWLWLSGSFNNLTRDGDRLTFPLGTETVLGTEYDYALRTGSISAEARHGSRGLAVGYQMSDFSNDLDAAGDRTGRVVSARLFGPCFFYDKLTHLARASYGLSELSTVSSMPSDIDYKLYTFQYTGVVRPVPRLRFAYTFDAQRVDNESTDLQTDRFRNVFDATVYHAYGSVSGGYAYETNDDDRSLTSFNSWQGAATFRYENTLRAKVRYDGRVKKDLEELTLLKDVESARFRADVDVTPISDLTVGGGFSVREREYPDIDVKSEGQSYRATARYAFSGWGALSGDYVHSNDEYTDLIAGFDSQSDVVTGRVDMERITNLRLSSGLTYIDVGKDLDIEKSILFFEGSYRILNDWHVEAKYNIYNYDDYVLLDRYYTANVVWFNLGYDFQLD